MKNFNSIVLLGIISLFNYSCGNSVPDHVNELEEKQKDSIRKVQRDSISKIQKDSIRTAQILEYKKNPPYGLDRQWEIEGFTKFKNDYEGFKAAYLEGLNNDTARLIRETNWYIYKGYFGHSGAIVYKRFFGNASVLNLNSDTLLKQLKSEQIVQTFKQQKLDVIDKLLDDSNVKEGRISKDLFQKFKLYRLLFSHMHAESQFFPIKYRNKRTSDLVWKALKPVLFKQISLQEFKKNNGDFYIETLLFTYDALKSNGGVDFFNHAITTNKDSLDYKKFVTVTFTNKFKNEGAFLENAKSMDYSIEQWKYWFFSYWYRRHIEGNTEIAYNALKEIQAHYK